MIKYIYYLITYGFLLTAAFGLLASWLDRKITARLQYRVGPPLFQPLFDIMKLLGKETLIPHGASKITFLSAPIFGFASVVLISTLLWINNLNQQASFLGDIIVVMYLLIIPALSIMMGGFASANPLASIGASREMKLILSYELPFIFAIAVPIIKTGFSIKIADILSYQAHNGFVLFTASGFFAFVAALLCMQAKLCFVPFDISEAEAEIVSGPLIEYSGAGLAVYKLMKNMLLFTIPFFLVILFLGGFRFNGICILYSILKYLIVLFLVVVIKNTNPRVRIDSAMRFFWGPVTCIALAAVTLALIGK